MRGDPQATPSHERIHRADLLTQRCLLPEGAEEGPSALLLAQARGLCNERWGDITGLPRLWGVNRRGRTPGSSCDTRGTQHR